jgi:transcription elongation factor GreA-like protein
MEKRELLNILKEFSDAAGKLSDAWTDFQQDGDDTFMVSEYPLECSFDEEANSIYNWYRSALESITKKYKIGVREVWEQMYEVEATSQEEAEAMIESGEGLLDNQFAIVEIDPNKPYTHYSKEDAMGFSYPIDREED